MKRTKLVYGIGRNDANYTVRKVVDGSEVSCPYYRAWRSMVQRCYSKCLHDRSPRYDGCSVSDEWLSFMSFREWMAAQDWQGKHLDKDIITPNNKIYSADTCRFIDQGLNKLLTDSAKIRGKYPIGVYLNRHANKFQAYIKKYGVRKSLGYFKTPEEAAIVYRKAKTSHIIKIALEQTDRKVRDGLILHASNILGA